MATSYSISVPVAHLIPPGLKATPDSFANLSQAVQAITVAVHGKWVRYALGDPLPSGKIVKTRDPSYSASIQMRQTGDFSAQVFSHTREADEIEFGRPARDLKKMLWTSPKVRRNKRDERYMIIPFRHGAPGSKQIGNAMPAVVHNWWRGKKPSHVTMNVGVRESGLRASDPHTKGALMTPAHDYKWGDRLSKGTLEGMGLGEQKVRRMSNMYNFRTPGGSGGGAHSQFITFRTMTQRSSGWITKAQPGLYPAMYAGEWGQKEAEVGFRLAVEADLKRLLGGS